MNIQIASPLASAKATFRSLVELTKPLVTLLLVFTAVTTAFAASGAVVNWGDLFFLTLAGFLTSGGSAAINHYLEKDLDRQMPRTAGRPLPAGKIKDDQWALIWGMFLIALGLTISVYTLPDMTTYLIIAGIVIYVPIYTLFLKRRTVWNVVLGGAAGAMPVLAGWSVARVDWPLLPIALALVVFFWTPAHFWAYAIRYKDDYGDAGFPMLPNVIGIKNTLPYVLMHAFFAVLASVIVLHGVALVVAAVSGVLFVGYCVYLIVNPTKAVAYKVYKFSNYYLMSVFIGILFL